MIKTRFAPSPTGLLHVGSVRPALVNYLFAKKEGGGFLLRIDDTDTQRSTDYFKEQILKDLQWLGISWDQIFYQSDRLPRYNQVMQDLLKEKRLYRCFETPEELDIKRKIQLSSGKPPIYDRAALRLSEEQIQDYLAQGRKPHYRFKLEDKPIIWQDLIRGEVRYQATDISDPIVIREDATFTYMLCSAVDDFDYAISHIFRGEDHINNTAIQLQMLESLNAPLPTFGHLSFLKSKDDKISKRVGGFEVLSLAQEGAQPMAINSFFTYIGTARPVVAKKTLNELVADFDIKAFSCSPTIYDAQELWLLNHKLLIGLDYVSVKNQLTDICGTQVDESFWLAVRANLNNLKEVKLWWDVCKNAPEVEFDSQDQEFLHIAAELLPQGALDESTWGSWTSQVSQKTGKKGRELFMPIRLALTGMSHGPEMMMLLPLINRDDILKRLGK